MTTLADVGASPTVSQRVADRVSGWLTRRTSRRGFLARSAVVGSALAVDATGFLLKPQSAYASVCGPGSTCASGWTVFCATVNKGVNACPPGSIAAGWWKADGASLCGGKARYIVDCNATCSKCGTGRAGICDRSCWSCSCTCGPAGQCDQRRVCCNGFRYGQCNTQVKQVGGVVCRVVSCLPPWTFERCTTAPATDNATRDHNSPALPTAWTAITARYVQLGELKSPLGPTVYGEVAVPGGRAQRYVSGRMSSRTGVGTFFTSGPIALRYTALGAEAGVLGFPVADPVTTAGGKASRFQRGRISWVEGVGAFETTGAVATRYVELGAEAGRLGFPVAPPVVPQDGAGRASAFQQGRISWHPSTGAHWVGRRIAARYVQLSAESGPLGYPVADQVGAEPAACAATFQKGRVVWSAATGAVEVYDDVATVWDRADGRIGLPLAPARSLGGGTVQGFQRGRVLLGLGGGFWVSGALAARHAALGDVTGPLGWLLADEHTPSPGVRQADFEGGSLVLDEATGQVSGP